MRLRKFKCEKLTLEQNYSFRNKILMKIVWWHAKKKRHHSPKYVFWGIRLVRYIPQNRKTVCCTTLCQIGEDWVNDAQMVLCIFYFSSTWDLFAKEIKSYTYAINVLTQGKRLSNIYKMFYPEWEQSHGRILLLILNLHICLKTILNTANSLLIFKPHQMEPSC